MAKKKELSSHELKHFGKTIAMVLFCLCAIFTWRNKQIGSQLAFAFGSLFLIIAVFSPQKLRSFEARWMAFGEKLSFVMSHIILALTFFAVFCPVGWVMRKFGRGSLKLEIDRSANSYWIEADHLGSGSRFYKPY